MWKDRTDFYFIYLFNTVLLIYFIQKTIIFIHTLTNQVLRKSNHLKFR